MGVYHTFSRGTPSRSLDLTSIRDLPFQRPALNASGEVGRLRDSEVGELDLAGIAQEHVRGGQDAMDDGIGRVRKVERGSERVRDVCGQPGAKRVVPQNVVRREMFAAMIARVTKRRGIDPRVHCKRLDMRESSATSVFAARSAGSLRPRRTLGGTEALAQAARRA
jgi:hypothetical protein